MFINVIFTTLFFLTVYTIYHSPYIFSPYSISFEEYEKYEEIQKIYIPEVKFYIDSNFYCQSRKIINLPPPFLYKGGVIIEVNGYIHYLWLCFVLKMYYVLDLFGVPNVY